MGVFVLRCSFADPPHLHALVSFVLSLHHVQCDACACCVPRARRVHTCGWDWGWSELVIVVYGVMPNKYLAIATKSKEYSLSYSLYMCMVSVVEITKK